jgi:hypothetical protein
MNNRSKSVWLDTPCGSAVSGRTGYDPVTDAYYGCLDTEDADSFPSSLVGFVAVVADADPADLPPLDDTVDRRRLTDLVGSTRRAYADVRFRYAGCDVTVTGDGDTVIRRTGP